MFERRMLMLVAALIVFLASAALWNTFVRRPGASAGATPPTAPAESMVPTSGPAVAAASDTPRAAAQPTPAPPPTVVPPVGAGGPSYIVLLARSEIRRRIRASAHIAYLNDIIAASPDSVLHRWDGHGDRKSTRLNSSHRTISYAVFCLKVILLPPRSTLFPYTTLFRSPRQRPQRLPERHHRREPGFSPAPLGRPRVDARAGVVRTHDRRELPAGVSRRGAQRVPALARGRRARAVQSGRRLERRRSAPSMAHSIRGEALRANGRAVGRGWTPDERRHDPRYLRS